MIPEVEWRRHIAESDDRNRAQNRQLDEIKEGLATVTTELINLRLAMSAGASSKAMLRARLGEPPHDPMSETGQHFALSLDSAEDAFLKLSLWKVAPAKFLAVIGAVLAFASYWIPIRPEVKMGAGVVTIAILGFIADWRSAKTAKAMVKGVIAREIDSQRPPP